MATYKDIHGSSIQNVDGNPDNPKAGQFWYDSSISEFKYQDQFKGNAWSGILQFLTETNNAPEVRAMFRSQLEQREKPRQTNSEMLSKKT